MSTEAKVPVIPECDLCDDKHPAYADAKIPGGSWANMCKPMFNQLGCKLGLGHGQKYVLQETSEGGTWIDQQEAKDRVKFAKAMQAWREGGGSTRAQEYAENDLRFGLWLYYCDKRCQRLVGLSIFDLSDHTWRDDYDGGTSPKDAVTSLLENDDMVADLMGG